MNKDKYFLKCMVHQKYMNKKWINRAFSVVREDTKVEDMQDWDLLQTNNGFQYMDPNEKKLMPINGSTPGEPLYKAREELKVKMNEISIVSEDINTTYGRVLYHYIVFHYPFNGAVSFQNKPVNLSDFEDELAKKLVDEPESGIDSSGLYLDAFYPSQVERYYRAVSYTRSLTMLFVPAISQKALTTNQDVLKRREELFNDPKIDLSNPVVAAQIEKELVDMDLDALKDDPSSGFLINRKDILSRKKRYISFGSPPLAKAGKESTYISRSLNEGLDVNHFPDYANEIRYGSYARGVETQDGGELDKWLVRQSSDISVDENDCGSKVGIPTLINDNNKTKYLGYYIVENNKTILLDESNIGNYINKVVNRRSPATCKTKAPDFCKYCLGSRLSMNPDAISLAFSQIGHDFMGESMSAMHGKSLAATDFNVVQQAR